MKQFSELTEQQQEAAIDHELNTLLGAILEGAIRFKGKLGKAIRKAAKQADAMYTPWLAGEYIMDAAYKESGDLVKVRDVLRSMAKSNAEDALYLEPGEYAICLSKLEG